MIEEVIKNFIWRFAERCGAQLVSFVVSIFLARALTPEDYGQVVLIVAFVTIIQVFVESGLGAALIQKKDVDDLDFSSVFYFNFVVCVILYVLMYLFAPIIAQFYGDDSLTLLIRVIGLSIIILCIKGIQQSYISHNMLFKKFFFSTLGGTIFSGILGVWLAYTGAGIWAIVAQKLSNIIIDTLILWLTVKWRPKKMFSWTRIKELMSFGWRVLASSLLSSIYNNLRSLIIGKLYSSSDLAYYNQGCKFPKAIMNNIDTSIDSVTLPTMSNVQDDKERVKQIAKNSIKMSTYVMAPLMIGLAFCAETIVKLILTDKWLACTPYLRIFCIVYIFYPIHTANLNAIKAMGRSDLFLKLEIVNKIIGMIILLLTINHGVLAIAFGLILSNALSLITNSWPNNKLLNYTCIDQIRDIVPSIALAFFMGVCVKSIELFNLSTIVTLLIQIPLGVIIYIAASAILHLEPYEYLMDVVRSILKRNEEKHREL